MTGLFNDDVFGMPKVEYEYITSNDRAKQIVNDYVNAGTDIETDTEGTGLDPLTSKITLLQMRRIDKDIVHVFDVRNDLPHCDVDPCVFKPVLCNNSMIKIFQNAVYDMKMMKTNFGYYPVNIYDTMLVEQLLHLGIKQRGFSLYDLVYKYLGIEMDKEPRYTFKDYGQTFTNEQLTYAANDVVVLDLIRQFQSYKVKEHGLEEVCRLEFEFTKPLSEMELNGIRLDKDRWNDLVVKEKKRNTDEKYIILKMLERYDQQTTMFGVPDINIDSNPQLLSILNHMGLKLSDTNEKTLSRLATKNPVIAHILDYRKTNKILSTYSETLLSKIHKVTNRLHTNFTQMVSTGRLSSKKPNLQNIPGNPLYRACFVAEEGNSLVTADMAGAELRILGNMSEDPIFLECYSKGIDLHTRAASEVFGVSYDEVMADKKKYRTPVKSIQFGLCYGLAKFGLAARLNVSEDEAQSLIDNYFSKYKKVKSYLDKCAMDGVRNRFSTSIAGRKRFYRIPPYGHDDYKKMVNSTKRKAMNMGIQASNADTIKQAMINIANRIEERGYSAKDAKLILTVHDEVVVEARHDLRYEVADLVSSSIIDGFGRYFTKIPMETDALIGPCWLKDGCSAKGCGCTEMIYNTNDEVVCKECNKPL